MCDLAADIAVFPDFNSKSAVPVVDVVSIIAKVSTTSEMYSLFIPGGIPTPSLWLVAERIGLVETIVDRVEPVYVSPSQLNTLALIEPAILEGDVGTLESVVVTSRGTHEYRVVEAAGVNHHVRNQR